MARRLAAITGEYVSKQDNQQKAEWSNVGVLITGKNGKDYVMLDPAVNLAGILIQQNLLAAQRNEAPSKMVMLSVFDDDANQQNGNQQQQYPQGGYQQQGYQPAGGPAPAPQGNYQQQPTGGYQRR